MSFMGFSKIAIICCVLALVVFPLPASAQLSEELVLSHADSKCEGWTQYITATVTNTSRFLYKSAEVAVKITGNIDSKSPVFNNAVITTANIKPGSVWHIKYAVPTSVIHNNDDCGFMITRVSGVRNGNIHISYRSSSLDVPFIFINPRVLHGSMTSPMDLFGAVASYPNSTENIKSAIKAGADVNMQNDEGDTPLIKAVLREEPDVVGALLEGKSDPNVENFDGATALDYAMSGPPGKVTETILSALQKAGAVKGSGNKAMYSSNHSLFARVEKFGSDADSADIHVIEGTVTNLTAHQFSYAELDANFQFIDDVVDSGLANIQNLGPHETWHFKITSLTKDADDYKLTKLEGR